MRHVQIIIAFLVINCTLAFTQVPSTEIYLIKVTGEHGHFTFGEPKNITNREGYDNQPAFLPNGKHMLYVSIREDKQADIYRYNIKRKKAKRLTKTSEDEYSPTLMPDWKHFSVVRVEKDSTQRLWQFDMRGKHPKLLLPNVKGVGYHAWVNDSQVALFILGDTFTLQLANIKTGEVRVLDKNIGRSIQVSYGGWAIYYVSKQDSNWYLMENTKFRTPGARQFSQRIGKMPRGVEDFTIDYDNNIYTGCGGQLLYRGMENVGNWDIKHACIDVRDIPYWQILSDFGGSPVAKFYRLVFSLDMEYLALVVYTDKKP
jgi:hypothetical protein